MLTHAVYTEPVAVPDTFVSGLADIEDLGDGNYRFTFFARRKSLDYAGASECEVVARIVMPSSAVLTGVKATMIAMGVSCCGGGKLRSLAH